MSSSVVAMVRAILARLLDCMGKTTTSLETCLITSPNTVVKPGRSKNISSISGNEDDDEEEEEALPIIAMDRRVRLAIIVEYD